MNTASPPRNTRVPHPARVPAEPPGRVEVTHVANRAFAVFVHDHELTVDQLVEAGGEPRRAHAGGAVRRLPASCVASDAARFLQLLEQPYQRLRVRADFAAAGGPSPRIASLRLRILLPDPLAPAVLESLRAVVGHCAVHTLLRVPPEVSVEFVS
ncbi:OsmC family peroxiredoxin [Streptomyces sp. NPDC047461]|uniref:OsmC family protein n=1 Tax=Streptomyces sp. NPDC047461 TaxID=3155619 RepID=UPI0033F072A0